MSGDFRQPLWHCDFQTLKIWVEQNLDLDKPFVWQQVMPSLVAMALGGGGGGDNLTATGAALLVLMIFKKPNHL